MKKRNKKGSKRIMEWNKNLSLEEVIDMCSKHNSGDITTEELQEWANGKLIYRAFIPIEEKVVIIEDLLNRNYGDDPMDNSAFLEMNKFWYYFLEYTNIENDKEELMTVDNYNTLFPNLYPAILSVASLDYSSFQELLHSTLSFGSQLAMIGLSKNLTDANIKKMAKIDKDLLKILEDPQKLEIIKDILLSQDDAESKTIKKQLQKAANKIANEEIKQEKE